MGKKARSHIHRVGSPGHTEPPARILQRFKSLYQTMEWVEALDCYRVWASRTGKQRDLRIESELLFRSASVAWQKGDIERSLARLAEASPIDPDRPRRYLLCRAICLARKGRLKEAIELFARVGDPYHGRILSDLAERNEPLPKLKPTDLAFESNQLLSFWQVLSEPTAPEPSSAVLRKLRNAYLALTRGEDPEPALAGLKDTPGLDSLALYLMVLAAVHLRRNIRIRHLITANPPAFQDRSLLALLDSHLLLLLKEKEYREIEVLKRMLDEHHLRPRQLESVMDELRFVDALDEIDAGRLESALASLREVKQRTPHLIHNMALLLEKMGELDEANDHWITLLRADGKPKRSDPEERRLAYAAAAKHIATNYLANDRHEEAVRYFKEVLSVSEDDREALENLAVTSLELGEHQSAVGYARRLYDLDPQNEQYLIGYLSALFGRGSFDDLLLLVEEHWERFPKGSSTRRALAEVAIMSAWRLRESRPEKARQIVGLVKGVDANLPHLLHLEGYFLDKDGKRGEAEELFVRLVDRTRNHTEQALIGMALHVEGFRVQAISMFRKLIACGCEESEKAFELIMDFLCQKNDHETARELCRYAIDSQGYSEYEIADMLYGSGRPQLAREFSEVVVSDPEAGEEDHFFHLLILNEIGNPVETLRFAESVRSRFGDTGDPDFRLLMDHVVRELKTKGRVKVPHG